MYSKTISDFIKSIIPNKSYISRDTGNSNVLITAPHGGGIRPLNIKTRTTGKLLQDTYTRRLSYKIIEMMGRFNYHPYYIIADIHRSKVDLNRSFPEATNGDKRAQAIWKEWNNLTNKYKNFILSNNRTGLLIDIHSHNDGNYFELGYNINSRDYLELVEDPEFNVPSTLDRIGKGYSLYEKIFGEYSIANSVEKMGYKIFMPKPGDVYFNGGYMIEHYSGNRFGAIQIECPVSILKYDIDRIALTLVNAVRVFSERFF